MGEQRDFGIAVTDAKRLNDCWHELTEAFAARPPGDGDEAHYFQRVQASPGNEEWVHHCNSRNLAEVLLRNAILERKLPLWLRLREGDALADAGAIKNVTHKFFTTGHYLTYDRPKSYLEGRPLWIKIVDWDQFFAGLMASRFGEQMASPVDGVPNKPSAPSLARPRLGRTPGSGSYATIDAPFLQEMAQHIANGKAMSAHGAAQLVADRASGPGGFNSKVSRLAKAFRSLERNGAA